MKYQKVVLKISGETFAEGEKPISKPRVDAFLKMLKKTTDQDIKITLIIGGGNFWRKRDFENLEIKDTDSDQIGMMATIMNGMLFSSMLDKYLISNQLFSSKELSGIVDGYNIKKARIALNNKNVVIIAGGTGSPFFTTDSAVALRALELDADLILKGTKVNGIYDKDPKKHKDAQKYDKISYEEAIEKKLKVLDQTAFSLAMQKRIPMIVFNIFEEDSLINAISEKTGTLVF